MTKSGRWLKRAWEDLLEAFGGHCARCQGTEDLEFAHVKTTQCHGMGRSKWKRYYDVLRNPASYRLLCMNCHDDFDGRGRRKKQGKYVKLRTGARERIGTSCS